MTTPKISPRKSAKPAIPKNLKYYLSGPMTGLEKFNYPLFDNAAGYLRYAGYHINSPAELFDEDQAEQGKLPYREYLRSAIELLFESDGIIMLPGWTQSSGARLEYSIAIKCKMPAYRYDLRSKSLLVMGNAVNGT